MSEKTTYTPDSLTLDLIESIIFNLAIAIFLGLVLKDALEGKPWAILVCVGSALFVWYLTLMAEIGVDVDVPKDRFVITSLLFKNKYINYFVDYSHSIIFIMGGVGGFFTDFFTTPWSWLMIGYGIVQLALGYLGSTFVISVE